MTCRIASPEPAANSAGSRFAGLAIIVLALLLLLPGTVRAQEAGTWRHALSLMGDIKYGPDFKYFSYVNPQAPKEGVVRFGVQGSFDSFNLVTAGIKGQFAGGVAQIYDELMTRSLDEPNSEYGLLAEAVRHPDDYSSVTFRLREAARWHDGKPVTAEDVVWSFEVQKEHSASSRFYYQDVMKAEATGEREVTFTFRTKGNRELPLIVGQLTVLPKHWWTGTAPDGRKRNIAETTLEPPLGSGPYRVKSFEAGRNLVLERVPDYWGANLPVNVGINNFNEMRYEYFRDLTVLVEAFKGDQFDFRSENVARQWVTSYDFPARRDGKVVAEEFAIRSTGVMQAFVPNLRRAKFSDPRVRQAMSLAFDFEEANKLLFFGLYERVQSYFHGIELASSGLPEGRELEILNEYKDRLPKEVFTTPYKPPVNGAPDAVRNNLREAVRLLREAGWEIKGGRLVNRKSGERFTVELLTDSPAFERVMLFYKPALERIGMEVAVRTVDGPQYENRQRNFDFDVIVHAWGQSISPGNEQRNMWGSASAERPGSQNYAGIRNPVVDELIEKVIFAKDRDELVAVTRAMDRVLLWNHYVIPNWTSLKQRTLRWDRFSRPAELPEFGASAFPTVWWWDAAKAARVGPAR